MLPVLSRDILFAIMPNIILVGLKLILVPLKLILVGLKLFLVPLKLFLVPLILFLVPLKIQTFEPNGTPYYNRSPFRCPKILFGPFRWLKSLSVFSRTVLQRYELLIEVMRQQ